MTERSLEAMRWDSYMFELEKIAAALRCNGMEFRHFVDMAALAWGFTGQQVDLTCIVDTEKGSPQ